MSLKPMVIGSLVILAGLAVGFAPEGSIAVFSQGIDFTDNYNATEYQNMGTFDNLEVVNGTLRIADFSQSTAISNDLTMFHINTEDDWTLKTGFIPKDLRIDTDSEGTFLTGKGGTVTTEDFYLNSGNATIEYKYIESVAPDAFELTLYSDSVGYSETVSLQPGSQADNYINKAEFSVPQKATDYKIEINVRKSDPYEAKLYSMRVLQSFSTFDAGSGYYDSGVVRSQQRLTLDHITLDGNNLGQLVPERDAIIQYKAYSQGSLVETSQYDFTENAVRQSADVFESDNIDSYGFTIYLYGDDETPRVVRNTQEGVYFTNSDFFAGDEFKYLLMFILIAMGALITVKG